MKDKKLGGRPKLASYQKRTKCFRVMFTENDYIYIQSKAEQAGLSVNEFCHQAAMDCQVCQRISPEMVSAIRDLSGIANNVNQICPPDAHLWFGSCQATMLLNHIRSQ